jgi:hypothetical protein
MTTYVQSCVDTSKNRQYLWTTDGNYASYGSGASKYSTLDERSIRTGVSACNVNKNGGPVASSCAADSRSRMSRSMRNSTMVDGPANNFGWANVKTTARRSNNLRTQVGESTGGYGQICVTDSYASKSRSANMPCNCSY